MFSLIVDQEITLELVYPSLAQSFIELIEQDREYLSEWLGWVSSTTTIDDCYTFIKKELHNYADGKSMVCGIKYKNELVGVTGFNTINPHLKKIEIGYWLASNYQGKGIITRVCQKLIDLAFNHYDMDKVQISAAAENTKSRAVCERLGMQLEGIITNDENIDGRILDHAVYGLHKQKQ